MSEPENNGQAPEPKKTALRGYRRKKEVEIELEPGVARKFMLVEMLGGERQKWQKEHRARYGVDYQGQPAGISEFEGMEAALISRCLHDENGKLIPAQSIQAWTSSLQTALYQMCLAINSISEKDQEKLKVD